MSENLNTLKGEEQSHDKDNSKEELKKEKDIVTDPVDKVSNPVSEPKSSIQSDEGRQGEDVDYKTLYEEQKLLVDTGETENQRKEDLLVRNQRRTRELTKAVKASKERERLYANQISQYNEGEISEIKVQDKTDFTEDYETMFDNFSLKDGPSDILIDVIKESEGLSTALDFRDNYGKYNPLDIAKFVDEAKRREQNMEDETLKAKNAQLEKELEALKKAPVKNTQKSDEEIPDPLTSESGESDSEDTSDWQDLSELGNLPDDKFDEYYNDMTK